MKLVVFEDDAIEGFGPLVTLRHASQLRRGTKTLLESVQGSFTGGPEPSLWGRDQLAEVCRESSGLAYNEEADVHTIFVNARARPGRQLTDLTARKSSFAAFAGTQLVAAKVKGTDLSPGQLGRRDAVRIGKGVERLEAPADSLFAGYWDLVHSNGLAIAEQAGAFEDLLSLRSTVEVRGPRSNLRINGRADVEMHVTFDTRLGPIVIEEGATVESFSRVMGPCYLGPRTKFYSALIGGGTSVFEDCKVGGQVENSVLMPHTNKAHHGYVGDSYIGEWVNLGAGSTFSNLKNTYGNVRVSLRGRKIDSGTLKLGPGVGDMAKVSIGAMVYSGVLLGVGCHVTGITNRNVPSFAYFDGSNRMVELLLESVLETQRRMMERRGKSLTRAGEALIRRAFKETSAERRKIGVTKGRLS